MEQLLIYLLKSAALLSIFFLAYQLLLRNDTSFLANRRFLFWGIIASLLLPTVEFTRVVVVENTVVPLKFLNAGNLPGLPSTPEQGTDWWYIAGIVYSIGLSFFLIRFTIHLFSLLKLLQKGNRQREGRYIFIASDKTVSPFSFFHYILFNPTLHSEEELKIIIEHEKAHASQHHSADVLLTNLVAPLLWFNPLSWWYRKSLIQNLEYLADKQTVAASVPKKEYQQTLVKISVADFQPPLANNFYQSLIKKRIIMLNKKPTKNLSYLKIGVAFPLVIAFMLLFNVKTEAQVKSTAGVSNVAPGNPTDSILGKIGEQPLYIIKNKEYTTSDLVGKTIWIKGFINIWSEEEATEKYGKKAKDGAIFIQEGKIIDDFNAALKKIDERGENAVNHYISVLEGESPRFISLEATATEYIIPPASDIIASQNDNKSISSRMFIRDSVKPLFIVDGETITNFEQERMNPDDIEHINVYKGQEAVKRYGEKGENGVVVITLKADKSARNAWQEDINSATITGSTKDDQHSVEFSGEARVTFDKKGASLYVVDGKIMAEDFDPTNLEASSIRSITVLKGDKATEKYGQKAAQGAIEINLKKKE